MRVPPVPGRNLMLFLTTQLDIHEVRDDSDYAAASDLTSPAWPFWEPTQAFYRRLDPVYYEWLRSSLNNAAQRVMRDEE